MRHSVRRIHRRKYVSILLLLVVVLLLLFGICRCAAKQKPSDSQWDNVVFYCQADDRWKNDQMGDSVYTLGDSGCLTTCLAALFQMQHLSQAGLDTPITPQTLNQFFSEHMIYDAEGNLQWTALEEVLNITFLRKEAAELEENELETLFQEHCYPIASVTTPAGNSHFVLLLGMENGMYWCMDPARKTETAVSLERYENTFDSVRIWIKMETEE